MTQGPIQSVPIACRLPTIAEAKAQVEKWQAFDADYALSSERSDSELVIHYAKVDDSISRLRDLVEVEQRCCAFVQWDIDESGKDLRLIARGSEEQLAALNVPIPQH
jgi:hypothetical protein